ncbi:MAG TPA: Fe-S cluster assembly protein SufD, partial [Candidatus Sulfotelmatobacter sp.]|nr:Fe-S cluster assembly protein SufD [Candidatus Sulfotelmatobacter sp.]
FTSVAPIAQTRFRLGQETDARVTPQALAAVVADLACHRLVFVNGRFAPALSSREPLPRGVRVESLARATVEDRGAVEAHLARYADYERDAFRALNTAFLQDGAFVALPAGTALDVPIHFLYLSAPNGEPVMTHPRNLLVVGDGCQASIVEDYVSLRDGVHFTNALTELVVGENSTVSHYLIAREAETAFNVSTLRSQQARSSSLTSHSVLLGGALVRRNVHPVLNGEGGECLLNGLFVPHGRQHMDNYMYVEHASPHCDSRQFYRGILDDHARGVFHGRIIVHKGAQKTDAKQTNNNLLLSENAQIDTKPQLEIYADDVKCTHGATIGQLDEEQLFYLRSRGIDEVAARAILLEAFASESLDRMNLEPVRRQLRALLQSRLPGVAEARL